ncbi:MAG: sensor domain-containing diguanylate cyclase [Syntrophales bacterium]|nr:sensor domain-containing diguanylate cyclase [Syntrophales bacterium]
MSFLNMRMAFLTNIFVFSILTAMVGLLWWQTRKRYQGMFLLFIDFILQTVSVVFLVLRQVIPDILSIGMANILVVVGSILGYIGLQQFVNRRTSQVHNYILLAVFSVCFIYFSYVPTDFNIRNFIASLGFLIIWAQCFWLMTFQVGPEWRPLTRGVGLAFGGLCLVNVWRILHLIDAPPGGIDYMQAREFQVIMVLAYQMFVIILVFNLVLMVNKRLIGEIRVEEEKFSKAFRSSPAAIIISRLADAIIVDVNDGFEAISGYKKEEVIGKTALELKLWRNEEDRKKVVAELLRSGSLRNWEIEFTVKSGEKITGILSVEVVSIGGEQYMLSTVHDITDRKIMEEKIRELSLRDEMTGLYNRRGFFTLAEQEIRKTVRTGKKLLFTYIDCDGLKAINDMYGHEEGDRVLKATADILRQNFRMSDIIARMGGDEFVVLSTDAEIENPEVITRRLATSIETYNKKQAGPWQLDMSWGTAVYDPVQPVSLDELMAQADGLMYQNKKAKMKEGP